MATSHLRISFHSALIVVTMQLSSAMPVVGQVADTTRARQEAERRLGRSVSQAEVLRRIQESGLSQAQIRQRLAQAGYDPGLADQYIASIQGQDLLGGTAADSSFVAALARIGILGAGAEEATLEVLLPAAEPESARGPQVYGRDVFLRISSEFAPITLGPVDPDYRIGPGDEIHLVLTGDVELAYPLEVSREGFLIIPNVGQVAVNGLTLAMLEARLHDRLGQAYSGLRQDPPTTHMQVSLGSLRMNQVFVIGDVVEPGAKQVSSVGTVWNALFRAGGPTESGSFRHVEVLRGNRLVRIVDLYDYLLRGDASDDIRLEHGDRVFVPPAGPQVTVEGAVRRPAIYEVVEGEALRDVIAFAGGLEPQAVVRRISIDRILPPTQRTPGRYRALLDVELAALSDPSSLIGLEDGDIIRVFAVSDERRDRIWLDGAVNNPGVFEWSPGLGLAELVDRADGLSEDAYLPRLQIYRRSRVDGTRTLIQAPAPGTGTDVALAEGDSIVVLSRETLANPASVSISGFVKVGGDYAYAAGMSLRDLLLAADGFTTGARVSEVEVFRMPDPSVRSDTTALVIRVPLGEDDAGVAYQGAGDWPAALADVELARGDRVVVRRAPGYAPLGFVDVTGEVMYPGAYALTSRSEPVASVLRRAGWLTDEAHLEGIRLTRGGTLVAVDIGDAVSDPGSRSNIALEPGDAVHVSRYDPTVNVNGAVMFASKIMFREGRSLPYYLEQAGGLVDQADKDRITISYANGERAGVHKILWVERWPEVRPGASIYVPAEPEDQDGFDWSSFLSTALTVASTTATLLIAISQLNKN